MSKQAETETDTYYCLDKNVTGEFCGVPATLTQNESDLCVLKVANCSIAKPGKIPKTKWTRITFAFVKCLFVIFFSPNYVSIIPFPLSSNHNAPF